MLLSNRGQVLLFSDMWFNNITCEDQCECPRHEMRLENLQELFVILIYDVSMKYLRRYDQCYIITHVLGCVPGLRKSWTLISNNERRCTNKQKQISALKTFVFLLLHISCVGFFCWFFFFTDITNYIVEDELVL